MQKRVLCMALSLLLTSTALAQKKANNTGPVGVPEPNAITSITLACRQGKGREVVDQPQQIQSFVSSLRGVAFWNTEKIAGPVTITIKLKRGGVLKPDAYLDGRVVFAHKHYKLGPAWLDRPLCGLPPP